MTETTSHSGLPPVYRVVTGNDETGLAAIRYEDRADPQAIPTGEAAFLAIWATAAVPADNGEDADCRDRTDFVPGKGSGMTIVDMMPGASTPMHRTDSVDYAIVLGGEVELELDGGAVRTLRTGDIAVQRGTSHLWRNAGTVPCRMAFVVVEALPLAE